MSVCETTSRTGDVGDELAPRLASMVAVRGQPAVHRTLAAAVRSGSWEILRDLWESRHDADDGDQRPPKAMFDLVFLLIGQALDAARTDADLVFLGKITASTREELAASPKRRLVVQKLELALGRFAEGTRPCAEACRAFATLLEASGHAHTKQGLRLARRLLIERCAFEASPLIDVMLRLMPMGRGFFNLTIMIHDQALRERLQNAHFARLEALARNDQAAAALLGAQTMQTGRFDAAAALLAEKAGLGQVEAMAAYADVLFWRDRFAEAEAMAEDAVRRTAGLNEKQLSSLYIVLARCKIALGNGAGALAVLDQRHATCPVHGGVESTSVLGGLAAGLPGRAFDSYWSATEAVALRGYALQSLQRSTIDDAVRAGARLKGHCVVTCMMGLGDEVRFAQLLPEIASYFDTVTVVCDRRNLSIFGRNFPQMAFRGVDERTPVGIDPGLGRKLDLKTMPLLQAADYVADLKQFAAVLRTDLDQIPGTGHHLDARGDLVSQWRGWLADRSASPIVGLFWRSGLLSHGASHKQSDLSDWLALLEPLGVGIVPLQYDTTPDEQEALRRHRSILALPADLDIKNDLEQTFALMAALPLIVSLPGTTQHMAGAVGARVLCPAHPYEANWRRVKGRSHEIWAPSVEIISGAPSDGLEGSVRLTVARLKELLEARSGQCRWPT